MTEMINKVMNAMVNTELDVANWNDDLLKELAIAAIKAMREPTQAMIEAAAMVCQPNEIEPIRGWYNAMIDEALK